MKPNVLNKLRQRKRRILKRIENRPGPERERPMITASNIQYELADRVQGLACGGIGAMLLVARKTGLIGDIDGRLHLLKRHLPYHESCTFREFLRSDCQINALDLTLKLPISSLSDLTLGMSPSATCEARRTAVSRRKTRPPPRIPSALRAVKGAHA